MQETTNERCKWRWGCGKGTADFYLHYKNRSCMRITSKFKLQKILATSNTDRNNNTNSQKRNYEISDKKNWKYALSIYDRISKQTAWIDQTRLSSTVALMFNRNSFLLLFNAHEWHHCAILYASIKMSAENHCVSPRSDFAAGSHRHTPTRWIYTCEPVRNSNSDHLHHVRSIIIIAIIALQTLKFSRSSHIF